MRAWPRRHSKLPALPLWESTRAGAQVARSAIAQECERARGEGSAANTHSVEAASQKRFTPHPSRHATCASYAAQDRRGKPSPTRGEGMGSATSLLLWRG